MGSNKNLFIILGIAVVALVATVMSGAFNTTETVDPATAFMQAQGTAPATTTPAVAEPEVTAPSTPVAADTTSAVEVPGVSDSQTEVADAAGAEVADATDGEVTDGDELAAADAEAPVEGVLAEDGAVAVAGDEEGVPELADEDLFLEDEELDPIERFKEMDPREIIDMKYDDLSGRLTTPWDEEDPDNFVPMTGRPDPLTRVHDAIPDELMPPRAGETDDSAIQTYAASAVATQIVDQYAFMLQCHNVLQVGLQKIASFSLGPQRFQQPEGGGFQVPFSVEGVNGAVIISITSISTDEVIVNFSATADAVSLGISKTQHYIPRSSV